MKMNMLTKTIFIIAVIMGTTMAAESQVFTQARGQVQASAQERAAVANMQYAPSNPDVTCIRAKIAFNKAKKQLAIAKKQFAAAQESGTGVQQATDNLKLA